MREKGVLEENKTLKGVQEVVQTEQSKVLDQLLFEATV